METKARYIQVEHNVMSKHSQSLTRICSSCGVAKFLDAFVPISSDICSSCRERDKEAPGDEEKGTIPTGVRIGSKERVERAREQRHTKNIRDLLQKESKKRETIIQQKTKDYFQKEIDASKHRKAYLTDQGFLKQTITERTQHRTDSPSTRNTRSNQEKNEALEMQTQESVIRQEIDILKIDTSTPRPPMQQIKYQSSAFLTFSTWLHGKKSEGAAKNQSKSYKESSPPLMQTLEKFYGKKLLNTEDKKATIDSDDIKEYLEKRLPPATRRR